VAKASALTPQIVSGQVAAVPVRASIARRTATRSACPSPIKIRAETGLTASAGVSYNKFLAKLASDNRKPDGLFVITPNMGPAFVEGLPVGKFHGVGPATTAKMNRLGIETGRDLRAQSMPFLQQHFGKSGAYYYWIARGVDDRPVRANRVRKSVGAENTFSVDLFTFESAQDALAPIIDKVWHHCESTGMRGRTVTLKIKYANFQQITRSQSLRGVIEGRMALGEISLELLRAQFPVAKGIRLLGISISALSPVDTIGDEQLPLGI
jgi:DNA polymerase IV